MKEGSEVVCVSTEGFWWEPFPKVGDINTVDKTKMHNGVLYLKLVGYNYDMGSPGKNVAFSSKNFVPLEKINKEEYQNIEVELSILV